MYGPDEEVAAAQEAASALKFIESHLFEDLTTARIASACATSEFHFSRQFSRRQGESVMAYVRGRRLDAAACRLIAEPAATLIDIALHCQFESQAAFTRAFTRAFGIAPTQFRKLKAPTIRRRKVMQKPVLEESVEFVETFQVAGLMGRFEPSTYVQVADLWQRFGAHHRFSGRLDEGETCGVFRDRNWTAHSFEHLAGARVEAGKKPEGLEVWTLPARRYLVFKQTLQDGELHPQVAAAQAEIWGSRLPNSGRALANAPDFQIYPANFKVSGGWLAYYVPTDD